MYISSRDSCVAPLLSLKLPRSGCGVTVHLPQDGGTAGTDLRARVTWEFAELIHGDQLCPAGNPAFTLGQSLRGRSGPQTTPCPGAVWLRGGAVGLKTGKLVEMSFHSFLFRFIQSTSWRTLPFLSPSSKSLVKFNPPHT